MALRCAGGSDGGGAYLTPPRSSCCGAGSARPAATTTGRQDLSILPRVPSSPRSKAPWVLRCSPDPSPWVADQHLARNERTNEAWEALKAMVGDMFAPLVRNVSDIRSLCSVYDLEDYQIGMLFGAFLGCVGCYQLWKGAPSVFVDAALAYAFYKLSVVSSEVRRQGRCNDLLTRLKFGIVVIMATRDFKKSYELLDIVKMPVFFLYLSTFLFGVARIKDHGKRGLILSINLLRTKGGFGELLRMLFYPDYTSPYDNRFHRK